MCGILGFKGQYKISQEELELMNDEMSHRGPDSKNLFINHFQKFTLGFAHRRLSIIDLNDRSNQPMFDNEKKVMLVYNGEIYNYKELKKTIGGDYSFQTDSDTEVILALYKLHGIKFVKKLHGIFSFAIYDFNHDVLHLVRDRNGVKPIYYYSKDDNFIFASELRPIMKFQDFDNTLDFEAVQLMLSLDYVPSPLSIFKYAKKLEPGCILTLNQTNKIKITQYWNVYDNYLENKNSQTSISQLDEILRSSVKNNLVADVPISTFFSGGIDSTLVSIIANQNSKNIQTFTIGFNDKKYDESKYAQQIAKMKNIKNHTQILDTQAMVKVALEAPKIYDEPFGDKSLIPTYLVSKIVNEKGFKVVLSGDGGDEFFYGYNRYKMSDKLFKIYNLLHPISILVGKLTSIFKKSFMNYVLYLFSSEPNFHYATYTGYGGWYAFRTMRETNLPKLHQKKLSFLNSNEKLSLKTKMALTDQMMYLPDNILTKVDRASMANSVESRVPLLEHPLILESYKSNTEEHINEKDSKILLKQLLKTHFPEYDFDKPKQGFSISKRDILCDSQVKNKIYGFTNKKRIKEQQIFDFNKITKTLKKYYNTENKKIESFVWNYFMFQNWYEYYIYKN